MEKDKMEEPIDAEIQPAWWTFSSGGVTLLVCLTALLGILAWSALSSVSTNHILGLAVLVVGMRVLIGVHRSAHRPTETVAWLAGNHLVVQDPNPWWKRLTDPVFGYELRLVVEAVEEDNGTLLVTAMAAQPMSMGRKFMVRLKPEREQARSLKAHLRKLAGRIHDDNWGARRG